MPPFTPPHLSANSGDQLWLDCVEQLAQELPEQQFNTWIRPLAARVSEDQTKVTVLVGNRFKLDWVRTQYAHRLAAILQQLQGHPITLELSLTPREIPVKSSSFRPMPEPELVMEPGIEAEAPAGAGFRTRLNSALTFDSLVEGSANRMARAAAMHVATIPGQLYNPLFIYGGVGLGKTHLVHAVGNKLLQDRPDAKVLYIHAE
ncbi:MAG: chromosomal replication initiator protein DnaA, partial [Betaproteobacteria bacterium]|nr:chromosomal replication initiator protein DnaA [Betaproteobacteria bacterium]